jgi:hypothetical protein
MNTFKIWENFKSKHFHIFEHVLYKLSRQKEHKQKETKQEIKKKEEDRKIK